MGLKHSTKHNERVVSKDTELTPEERELIEETSYIFDCFFRHATPENYLAIRKNDSVYQKALGKKYNLFLAAVSERYPNLGGSSEDSSLFYSESKRLLDIFTSITTTDIDLLWILYYATGDEIYSDRIYAISIDESQKHIIQKAAEWSINTNIDQGLYLL
jgi:hypothetical protein